jgi:ADP-heptose:LPS heptosyltransferase
VHAPLLSLPLLCKTTLESIPASIPYVFAPPALVAQWRERLAKIDGFRIGICWQGSPQYREDHYRSIPLRQFAALARIAGVRLISLQKGAGREQLAEVRDDFPVVDWADELDEAAGPFMDTAAIMKSLDLVITSDTATAHLAGAMGLPVWVALPLVPDWRWQLLRSDSPWYPSMRLFRQRTLGNWSDVFVDMVTVHRSLITCR